jgi:lactoylglutathione lyase
MKVRQLRLVVTVEDFDAAVSFYRDALGMPEQGAVSSPGGRVAILDAGRATLELADAAHAASIDALEVGERVAGHIRVALEVEDADAATPRLAAAGARVIAPPVDTPWGSRNARLAAPAGLQLTVFSGAD